MLPVLCLTAFVGILTSISLGPFLPVLAAEFAVPVSLLGQIPALTMLGGAALGLAVGPLADHFGYRRLLTVGTVAALATALSVAAALGPPFLLVTALCGAASRAVVIPVTMAIAGASFDGASQRRALSVINSAISVSGIAGVPVLTAIAASHGWRASFLALAAFAIATTVAARIVLPPDRHSAPSSGDAPPPRDAGLSLTRLARSYLPLLRSPAASSIHAILLASLLRSVTAWGFLTYLSAFLVERHAFSAQHVGWAFMLSGAGHFTGSLLIGGRVGASGGAPLRTAFATLHVFSGLLFAAAYILPLPATAAIFVFAAGSLVTGGADVISLRLLVSETPAGRATTLTLNGSGMSIGSALGSSLGGLLLAVGGYGAVAFLVLAAALAAAALAWLSYTPRSSAAPLVPAPATQ